MWHAAHLLDIDICARRGRIKSKQSERLNHDETQQRTSQWTGSSSANVVRQNGLSSEQHGLVLHP